MVDRATFPRDKACSEYMSPEGARHLSALGVLEAVEEQGGRQILGTTVHAPRGSSLTGLFARAGHAAFRASGLSVSRRLLDGALVEAAQRAGATILEGVTAIGVVRDGAAVGGLVVRDRDGAVRELRAPITVGADGLRSVVAREIGSRRPARLRRYAFVAHLSGVAGLGQTAELHVSARGYIGINPLGGGLANVALVVPHTEVEPSKGRAEPFFFERLGRFSGIGERLRSAIIEREVMVTGPFDAWSRRVTAPGALLLGDAADFFDPFTGEGICAAFRGAELAEPLIRAALERPGTGALAEYARRRRAAFLGKWVIERAIGYAMLAPGFFDRSVARLERRGLAHTLIGVTGDFVPPRAVLNPVFLSQVVF